MANLFGTSGAEIYLTVSQACGLELVELDKTGGIKSYAQCPLGYNETQREIANYDEFNSAIENVFSKANINPANANIHLSIPTVWFGAKDNIPLLLDENSIGNIVLTELEQKYLFKTQAPIPFWFDNLVSKSSDSRSIFYTAVQSNALEQIRSVLSSKKANLVSVECSLFANFRGLYVTGVATQQMDSDATWSLMIINNTGFQLIDMQGKKIVGYYDEPLPFKNFEGDEIYDAIDNAAQIAFMSTASSSLILVSETDLVSAQVMSEKLQFNGNITYVEDNKFRMEPLMELPLTILAEDQLKVSLHAIGHMVASKSIGMPVDVNFINDQSVTETAVISTPFGEITPQKASIILFILALIILLPLLALGFVFNKMAADTSAKSVALDAEIQRLEDEIAQYQGTSTSTEFNAVNEIETVLKNNRTKIMAYAALGESIPKNVYLTYFITGNDGRINIKGCAETVEDVYVFFKNLKDSLVESKLRISKLDLKSSSLDTVVNNTASTVDDAPYVFEITNMTEEELQAFRDSLLNQGENSEEYTPSESSSEETTDEEQ